MKFTIVRVNFEKIRSNTIGILILKRKIEGKLFSRVNFLINESEKS